MKLWSGESRDRSNFSSSKFLEVNSCGFQNPEPEFTVIRKKGRVDYHFLLILDGICTAEHNKKAFRLTEGSLIIYAPDEPQKYRFETQSRSLWCHFSGIAVKEIFESCNIKSGIYKISNFKAVAEVYSSLIQKFHIPGKENFATATLLELIYLISENLKTSKKSDKSEKLTPVLTYINTNYNKDITLDELSKMSGYSKSRFSHIFSEITGTTPIKYQNSVRLKLALEMLTATQLSVSNIAYSLGFNDPLYFSRIFKKEYGISPQNYRKSI